MSKELLDMIMKSKPNLAHGGLNSGDYKRQNGASFEQDRERLSNSVSEFELAHEWFGMQKKQQSYNENYTCGMIKDDIRKWAQGIGFHIEYISEGATIAAALAHGFRVAPLPYCRFKAKINIKASLPKP